MACVSLWVTPRLFVFIILPAVHVYAHPIPTPKGAKRDENSGTCACCSLLFYILLLCALIRNISSIWLIVWGSTYYPSSLVPRIHPLPIFLWDFLIISTSFIFWNHAMYLYGIHQCHEKLLIRDVFFYWTCKWFTFINFNSERYLIDDYIKCNVMKDCWYLNLSFNYWYNYLKLSLIFMFTICSLW